MSQGLALAILAWLQTLPEFAVEAVIAWRAGKDPAKVHLAIANFTGSIRLLVGLGWPLVYFVAAFFARKTGRRETWIAITFDDQHAIAISAGVSQFVFVQWVAPFLSEFPEKLSAFNWARQITKAPMAVMNLVSSTINQWSILSALIPVIYSISKGTPSAIVFDRHQRLEILLTILHSFLGWLLLVNLELRAFEAAILFVFWLVQFAVPSTRGPMIGVYAGWCGVEIAMIAFGKRKPRAFRAAWNTLRRR